MKGYKFPVKLGNFQQFKERVEHDGNTTFSFGCHIDIINESEGEVEIHVARQDIKHCLFDMEEMPLCIHEMTNLHFSYSPKEWLNTLFSGAVEIKEPDLIRF